VGDGGVAGDGFHLRERGAVRTAEQGGLDAAVLVAERDLEMEDFLAGALETKVAGLDDAGVHRADRDLVHLAPSTRKNSPMAGRCPRAPHGLEPGVALRVTSRAAPRPRARTGGPAGAWR
jgi:hypothetical protein